MPDGPPAIVATSRTFPQYAYGLLLAAVQAHRLGLRDMSALELGVAGGNGLVEMERLAQMISRETAVQISVTGFDLGNGMPPPIDYRDLPYVWQEGFFRMDESLLRSRLSVASLILGDIAETGRTFIASQPPPIGFISFDLDYYSSTIAAFEALIGAPSGCYLPRTICYFDDTVGPHEEVHCRFTGELLAIDDFNASSRTRKLARINGLQYKLDPLRGAWIEGMYALHDFAHPRYAEYAYHDPTRQFPLTQGGVEDDG